VGGLVADLAGRVCAAAADVGWCLLLCLARRRGRGGYVQPPRGGSPELARKFVGTRGAHVVLCSLVGGGEWRGSGA
jgi:hypothetical protein